MNEYYEIADDFKEVIKESHYKQEEDAKNGYGMDAKETSLQLYSNGKAIGDIIEIRKLSEHRGWGSYDDFHGVFVQYFNTTLIQRLTRSNAKKSLIDKIQEEIKKLEIEDLEKDAVDISERTRNEEYAL